MKKLMRVSTNAYNMFVTYDEEEQVVRFLTDSNDISTSDIALEDVEDDSSWEIAEDVENVEEWLGVDYNNPDAARIIEEVEFE